MSHRFVGRGRALLVGAVSLAATTAILPARADSVAEFYKGKTINMVIGYSVGGGYDLYGRLVARNIGKHIPGNPTVVPQNMTGAGSLRAAQFIYSVAPKDGTAIGTFGRQMGIAPLLTPSAAQYDGTKFTWLGSATIDVSLCYAWHTSPVKTWNDFLEKPITLGGEGPGADPDVFALLYRNVFDAKIKLVTGYHGTNDINLAMERGEVDGLCGISWSTVKSRQLQWYKDKKINLLVQASLKKDPDLPDVPLVMDLAKDKEQLQILKLILASQEMARPFAAPPGLPADRKAALVTAFERMVKEPEFLAEARKLNLDINPVTAKAIDSLLAELYATPKDVIEKAARAIAR